MGGTTESSVPSRPPPPPSPSRPFPRRINSRTVVAPVAAFTMACILFVYTRTSIRAAKENAQRHRNADSGGQGLSLLNEHRRRHGQAERLDRGNSTIAELAGEARAQLMGATKTAESVDANKVGSGRSEEEDRLRALKGRAVRKPVSEGG
ncbi:hypothetical protein LTR36_005085 [Oleoguttula mirabilis]|uniref:Uncharacterized protein n=1 Tax=Oleoguttula mirabilis TaxID=1507867 RepID=A0AAV9JW67_9PEZI|nr:hypothetical protein LTR36_005085 [Oleoguttula mirabilis]